MAETEHTPALPQIGAEAPAFTLPSEEGSLVSLADWRGQQVVLYFYPKDSTPGCTLEAQDFSRLATAFAAEDTKVFGISKDSVASHAKFCTKQSLGITLLSDEAGQTCEDYGVWGEKSLYGRKFMGITRATFLIDREGKIAQVWPKVKVKGHAEEVLAAAAAAK